MARRAALSSASQVSKPVDARVLSTRLVPTMMAIVEVAALATSLARQLTVGFASAPGRPDNLMRTSASDCRTIAIYEYTP